MNPGQSRLPGWVWFLTTLAGSWAGLASEPRLDDEGARTEWVSCFHGEEGSTIDALLAALESDWDSLSFSLTHVCSCTGFFSDGVKVTRKGDAIEVARWQAGNVEAVTRNPRELAGDDALVEIQASVAAHCQAAIDSVHPLETVGPMPEGADQARCLAWKNALVAAGGSVEFRTEYRVSVRVEGGAGNITFSNRYATYPNALSNWIETFGPSPRILPEVDTRAMPELNTFRSEMQTLGFQLTSVTERTDRSEAVFRRDGRAITVVKRGLQWWLGEPEAVLRPLGLFRRYDSPEEFGEALLTLARR